MLLRILRKVFPRKESDWFSGVKEAERMVELGGVRALQMAVMMHEFDCESAQYQSGVLDYLNHAINKLHL